MSRLSKPLAAVSAAYLIFYDLALLFGKCDFTGEGIFNTVFLYFIPCGILTGIAALCHLYDKNGKKIASIIAAVVAGFMAIVRLATLIFQFVLIAEGMGETGTQEYFEIAKFAGEIFILAAMVFLMIKFIRGSFTKTNLSLSLVACVIFAVYYVADVVFAVQSMSDAGLSGIGTFFGECLTADFVMGVLVTVAYLLLFSIVNGVFDTNQEVKK